MNGIAIVVKKEDKEYLDTLKEHPRETYGDIVHKLIECWKEQSGKPVVGQLIREPKEFVTPDPDSPTGIKEPLVEAPITNQEDLPEAKPETEPDSTQDEVPLE